MSMDHRLTAVFDADRTPEGAQAAVFRKPAWCWFWALLCVAAVAVGSTATVASNQVIASIIFLYALQALIAEGMGVRLSPDRISAPRRFHAHLPPLLLWRVSGPLQQLEYVASLSKVSDGRVAIMRWMDASEIPLLFASRETKLAFFKSLHRFGPQVGLYKRKS